MLVKSILLPAFNPLNSLLVTPLVIVVNYILCWKEEKELVREFGEDYENYQKSVPMFIPRAKQTDKQQ